MVNDRPAPVPYEYVRKAYNVPAYIGVPIRWGGKDGVIVKPLRDDQYIYACMRGGLKTTGPIHPTDGVEYFP